ncbi:MAG: cytochrome c oxidase subunit II [Alphaproteobacteria bacterium]|nr:cytochrome c oxidase subunit II [Alphaproteobacteria bacterium]
MRKTIFGLAALLGLLLLGAAGAWAAAPQPWQIDFQPAASPTMERIRELNMLLSIIIVAISIFVLGLLAVVIVRFNAKRNPTPSKTAHNTVLEVIWTVVPIMILVVIAIPSFKLLYFADRTQDAELTVKAVGYQWYWTYEYPDHDDLTFDALMVEDEDLQPGQPRLLETDNRVVVPVNTNVRLLTTAGDVLHSWAMPAFGVKLDAVPGRINETWFRATEEGVYYGQCSELCGIRHGFMPIAVEVVSKEAFAAWLEKAKEEFAQNGDDDRTRVAAAGAATSAK